MLESYLPENMLDLRFELFLPTALRKSREDVKLIVADLSGHFSMGQVRTSVEFGFIAARLRVVEPAGIFPLAEVI